jgi:hypothetical protein
MSAPRGNWVGQHSRGYRKEKLGFERHCPQGPDQCGIHLRTAVREIGEIQPDEYPARSACDPHKAFPSSAIESRRAAREQW